VTNYAIWGLFGPATWPLWLFTGAALGLWLSPRWRIERPLLTVGVLLFLSFGLSPLGHWLMRPLETRFPPSELDAASIRDIVVLSGAEQLRASAEAGRLEVSAAGERVLEGAARARRWPDARLWIVGGVRAPGHPVADSVWTSRMWERLGIEPRRVRAVDRTTNTCENARAMAARDPSIRPLLVTSAFHMPRSVACFRRHGIEPLIYPVDYQSWSPRGAFDHWSTDVSANLRRVDLAFHEWAGLAWYRLSARASECFPAPR